MTTDAHANPTQVLACVPGAIQPEERSGHFASTKRLFGKRILEQREVDQGREYRFDASAFDELCSFVANERKCCPFLAFEIKLTPNSGPIWLRLTGPDGIKSFLDAQFASPETQTTAL